MIRKYDYSKEPDREVKTWDDLLFYMWMGREIEFFFNEVPYFVEPNWNLETVNIEDFTLCICDSDPQGEIIFTGTDEQFIDYKFENKYTLRDNFDKFRVGDIF